MLARTTQKEESVLQLIKQVFKIIHQSFVSRPPASELPLPTELLEQIFKFADTQTWGRLSQVSAGFFAVKEKMVARKLVCTVMDADLNGRATQLIKSIAPEDGGVVLERVTEQEVCGRRWQVSALEFSVWAGDFTLTRLLLQKVPVNKKSIALMQLKQVKEHGLEHGVIMAPFLALIQEYKNYLASIDTFKDNDARDLHATANFSKLQYELPFFGLELISDVVSLLDKTIKHPPRRLLVIRGEVLHGGQPFQHLRDSFLGKRTDFIHKVTDPMAHPRARQRCTRQRAETAINDLERLYSTSIAELDTQILQLDKECAQLAASQPLVKI